MKAMIFAAGLGTRMRPLTETRPKALVEVAQGLPLLQLVILHLKAYGIREIIINTHYFAQQIIDFLEKNRYFDIHIEISPEKDKLLDTGGGLKKAAWFFDDDRPFLCCNTDILSNINLDKLVKIHQNSDAVATVAVRQRETARKLLFDEYMNLCGWTNSKTNEVKMSRHCSIRHTLAFSCFQIIEPSIFKLMPETDVFSTIDLYLKVSTHQIVKGYLHNEDTWIDVGTPQHLAEAKTLLPKIVRT